MAVPGHVAKLVVVWLNGGHGLKPTSNAHAVAMPEASDLTVGIMALVAQAEREAIFRRIKEALVMFKERGVKLGDPNGAAVLRIAGKGAVVLRLAVSAKCRPIRTAVGAGAGGYSRQRSCLAARNLGGT